MAAVHAEMEKIGRDPAELVVSMLWAFLGIEGTEQIIDTVGRYAEAGLHHMVGIPWVEPAHAGRLSAPDRLTATLDNMARFADEVLPAVKR